MGAALGPPTEGLQLIVEPQRFANHHANQDADQQNERIPRLERELDSVDRDEEADGDSDGLLQTGGDEPTQREAERRADENGAGVERGPEPGDQSFSKRSTFMMKTVAPPTCTSTG
jgi:hypothetical protein